MMKRIALTFGALAVINLAAADVTLARDPFPAGRNPVPGMGQADRHNPASRGYVSNLPYHARNAFPNGQANRQTRPGRAIYGGLPSYGYGYGYGVPAYGYPAYYGPQIYYGYPLMIPYGTTYGAWGAFR